MPANGGEWYSRVSRAGIFLGGWLPTKQESCSRDGSGDVKTCRTQRDLSCDAQEGACLHGFDWCRLLQ